MPHCDQWTMLLKFLVKPQQVGQSYSSPILTAREGQTLSRRETHCLSLGLLTKLIAVACA